MHDLLVELFPIDRSLTGEGVRQTLARLGELIPLRVHEIPTGTRVGDWEVPREWVIRDAYVEGPDGRRIADFRRNNLHLVGYSTPVDAWMTLDEAAAAPALARGPARRDPLRDLLLQGALGLLPGAPRPDAPQAGHLPGGGGQRAGGRLAHLRRPGHPGAVTRGGPAVQPTCATPRWPTTSSRGRWSRPSSPGGSWSGRAATRTASSWCRRRSARWPTSTATSTSCAGTWWPATW